MWRKSVSLLVAAIVLCGAGVALAAAVKVNLAHYAGGPDEGASGQAVLNFAKGANKTEIQINCQGLTPDTNYTVYLSQTSTGPTFDPVGDFTTHENGKGNLHLSIPGDVSASVITVNNTALNASVLQSQ